VSKQLAQESTGHSCAADCSSRRTMLVGAGAAGVAALLAGCQTYGNETPSAPAASDADPGTQASTGASAPADQPKSLAKVADVPVGGGKIIEDEALVVTQPTAGVFKAFSAICTHQGCVVSGVNNGKILCACHGSEFKISDGSVVKGPASRRLEATNVKVSGSDIVLA
jgi:Rieske Fe-S protein